MSKKFKWTWIDTLIVILVIAAGAAVFKVFGGKIDTAEKKTVYATVLLTREDKAVADAINVGDTITVSLTEKDSGILKDIEIKDTETMVYNSIDGVYVTDMVEDMVDIYATVELEVSESDYAYSTGSTFVKVGEKMPFRGKGYALEGYITEVREMEAE